MRSSFLALPNEIEEATRLDGASDFQVFYKVVVPLSLPAIASFAVLQFAWVWSDFFFALLYIHTPELFLGTQAVPMLKGQYYTAWDLVSAASIILMSVPLLIYAFLNKYFIRGVVGWVLKG